MLFIFRSTTASMFERLSFKQSLKFWRSQVNSILLKQLGTCPPTASSHQNWVYSGREFYLQGNQTWCKERLTRLCRIHIASSCGGTTPFHMCMIVWSWSLCQARIKLEPGSIHFLLLFEGVAPSHIASLKLVTVPPVLVTAPPVLVTAPPMLVLRH